MPSLPKVGIEQSSPEGPASCEAEDGSMCRFGPLIFLFLAPAKQNCSSYGRGGAEPLSHPGLGPSTCRAPEAGQGPRAAPCTCRGLELPGPGAARLGCTLADSKVKESQTQTALCGEENHTRSCRQAGWWLREESQSESTGRSSRRMSQDGTQGGMGATGPLSSVFQALPPLF